MKLINILKGLSFEKVCRPKLPFESDIQDIIYNSKEAGPDTIFVAIPGETTNSHNFIDEAYQRGCRFFVISEDASIPEDARAIKVENARVALSIMSSNLFGNPSKKLKVIGVTGTKGKTTITNFIATVLKQSGKNTGIIGTNGTFYNGIREKTSNTTPESYELQRIFKNMLESGVEYVCIEVSSGGLMMHRVDDVDFDIAVFTNISKDHIGPKEHPTFENYLECKASLFTMANTCIVNRDADYSSYIIDTAEKSGNRVLTYGIHSPADFRGENIKYCTRDSALSSNFICSDTTSGESTEYLIASPGEFSVYNALSVISTARAAGLCHDQIIPGLSRAKVEGRVEMIDILPGTPIILDYAHNGISLENILMTLKLYNPKRLLCLFGSVGGRTNLRRQEMGKAASKYADIAILTSDNPDFEDPENIMDDIEESFEDDNCRIYREADRTEAVRLGISLLKPGDILLLAGKGHEEYQLINGVEVPYSDREVAIDAAKEKLKDFINSSDR